MDVNVLLLGGRLILGGVFFVAALAKVADRPGSLQSLRDFGLPDALVPYMDGKDLFTAPKLLLWSRISTLQCVSDTWRIPLAPARSPDVASTLHVLGECRPEWLG